MPFPDIKRLPIPLPLLIIIVGGLLITLLVVFKPSAEIRPTGNLNPLVKTLMAEPAAHSPMITLYGRVESPRESNLAATVNAYVDSVPVEEGDMVTKGQVLVELEDSDVRRVYEQRQAEVADMEAQIASEKERYQNDLASLEVEKKLLALSKKSAERYEKLVAKNVGSDLNRDEALQLAQKQELSLYNRQYAVKDHPNRLKRLNAQLQKLTAFRDQAATDLARTKITAPFNGRVIQLKASPGNRVHPGDIVATVYDTSHIEVRAQIPSRYLAPINRALNSGQPLNATLMVGGDEINLKLERLAGAIGMGQGGVDGLFSIDNEDRVILGRAGEVILLLPPVADALALPPTAIYGQQRVYAVQDERLKTIMIERLGEVLMENGERWQLVKGDIAPGTQILTSQLPDAVGGLAVQTEATPNE
ncbi:MAG: HlyD family efflux transporter periplasmic adaptor subunit [Pseudomonadales bacterium]|nr:HlyD family efflux transporter periplasmic adaptor subunit [Pseudomonadales bacterium]